AVAIAPDFRCSELAASRRRNPPLLLRGARVALSASEAAVRDFGTSGGRIAEASEIPAGAIELALEGYVLLPGLINAHDHLDFALFPRMGSRHYRNFREWAEEIYQPTESPVREHASIPKSTRLWWGGLRNLLSGVTTVCH